MVHTSKPCQGYGGNFLGVSYLSNAQGSTLRLTNRDISSSNGSVRRPTHLVDRRDLVDRVDAFV